MTMMISYGGRTWKYYNCWSLILFVYFITISFAPDVSDYHDWLLAEDGVDLLPRLLLPLAGPEEFDEEVTDKLPIDLQYLPSDKAREIDAGIRGMLVESIHHVRFFLSNTYNQG